MYGTLWSHSSPCPVLTRARLVDAQVVVVHAVQHAGRQKDGAGGRGGVNDGLELLHEHVAVRANGVRVMQRARHVVHPRRVVRLLERALQVCKVVQLEVVELGLPAQSGWGVESLVVGPPLPTQPGHTR